MRQVLARRFSDSGSVELNYFIPTMSVAHHATNVGTCGALRGMNWAPEV